MADEHFEAERAEQERKIRATMKSFSAENSSRPDGDAEVKYTKRHRRYLYKRIEIYSKAYADFYAGYALELLIKQVIVPHQERLSTLEADNEALSDRLDALERRAAS